MGVVVVTGGSRGIGADICRLAAEHGHSVCVNYVRGQREAHAVVDEIGKRGGHAIAVQADVTNEDQVVRMFDEVKSNLGQITALVNNAGEGGQHGPIESWQAAATRHLIEVNLFGPMICSREAVKRMAPKFGGKGGSIINISSASARTGSPGVFVHYAATKGGLDVFTTGLAKEVAKDGIRVNAVRPGYVRTEMYEEDLKQSPEWVRATIAAIPMGRMAEVRDVSSVVVWLLSDEASYVTGSIIDISGGRVTQ
ncbi:MAG TPA: SDR family oxidoreductase [Alphaproteobacteria bacterium]|nr:SDR family oxidoreductase [Alphaproteobacteria bacterium]